MRLETVSRPRRRDRDYILAIRGWRGSYYVGPDSAVCTRAPEDGVYEPYWSQLPHAADTCPELASCTCNRRDAIGGASYGTLASLLDFQLFNFFVTSEPHTLWHSSMIRLHVVAYRVKNIQAYSFVAIYFMNSIIFLCVNLKLFSISFVPLLAPNPGVATEGCRCRKAALQWTAVWQCESPKLSNKSTTR